MVILVVDDLSHVHNKCDDLMAKLKALNQAAEDTPMASVVSTSPFVTPIITPVHDSTEVRGSENLSKVAVTADAVSEGLIEYLTNPVVVQIVESNTGSVELNGQFSNVQLVEANVVINEAGVWQPIKSIGEMLNELPRSRKRNDHIQESNIIISTPVFDQCVSDFSMKTKQTPKFKKQGLQLIEKAAKEKWKGVGQGDGGAVSPAGDCPWWWSIMRYGQSTNLHKTSRCAWEAGKCMETQSATSQLAKAAKKWPSSGDDYERSKKRARDSDPKQKKYGKGSMEAVAHQVT